MIDGDTVEIRGWRIRLHGIDAPESRQLCRRNGKPWQCGKDAANALARKIARRPVRCEDLGRDRYDRIIGRCTVADGDLGAWMVSQGLALATWGRGRREPELVAELQRLRSEAERLSLTTALPALDQALKAA